MQIHSLQNTSIAQIAEFGNAISIFHGIVLFYKVRLQEMEEQSVKLIETLRKEYHLSDEKIHTN